MRFSKIINNKQKGFTLIELLVVIGILAVLLAITLIAINPARQFQQANDTKRTSDVNAILNAINQYMADNRGSVPLGIGATVKNIGSAAIDANICAALTTATSYIASMPFDPKTGSFTDCTNYDTKYRVVTNTNNRITVSATGEITTNITVTR